MAKKKLVKPTYVPKANRKKEPMSKELKMGLLIGAAVLVVAVVLFAVLYDDGSLPVKSNSVVAEDTWIISNLSATQSGKKYYKLGEVTAPLEGYTLDPTQTVKSDANEKSFWYKPDDETAQMQYYYVAGVNSSPKEISASAHDFFLTMYGENGTVSEVKSATVSGHEILYFSNVAEDTAAEPAKTTQTFTGYLPAVRNASVLISFGINVTEEMPEKSEEELLAIAEQIARKITLETGKK